MPTYEYKCNACGHTFERFQSMSSAPVKRCPECGKAKVKRLLGTGAGLIFKGSGFYITDYRDSAYNDKAKSESGGDTKPAGDGKVETKSESKSEAKTETKAESKPAEAKPAAKSEPKSSSKSSKKKS